MSTASGALGAVYDRGYRPYEGPRGGRARCDVRAVPGIDPPRASGIRRSWRQKVFPWVLLADRDCARNHQRRDRLRHA